MTCRPSCTSRRSASEVRYSLDEDGTDCPAELFKGCVGRVFWAAAGKAPEDLLGLGGAEAQGGGVLDDLVVLSLYEVPPDRAGQYGLQVRVFGFAVLLELLGTRYWVSCCAVGVREICSVGLVETYPAYVLESR